MRNLTRIFAVTSACMALAACSLFGDDKNPDLEPAELIKFKPTIEIKRLWKADLGDGAEFLRLALRPAGVFFFDLGFGATDDPLLPFGFQDVHSSGAVLLTATGGFGPFGLGVDPPLQHPPGAIEVLRDLAHVLEREIEGLGELLGSVVAGPRAGRVISEAGRSRDQSKQ